MTRVLRSLLRVRFLWLPAIALLFGAVLVGVGLIPVTGSAKVVAASFLTVFAVLAVGLLRSVFR